MENKTDIFRGLLYNPSLEHEVVILFSLLIPHLKESYAIDSYPDTFPDCSALRNGKRVEIEFEVYASDFYSHNHDKNDNLSKCMLLICWKNNIRNTTKREGKEFFVVKGHEIEITALDKAVAELEKDKGLKFVKNGDRLDLNKVGEEIFFEQLKENRPKRYDQIKDLYNYVKQSDDFEIKWGGGDRWSTMRVYVKKWNDVYPISFRGDGYTEIGYQGNKSIFPWWELPQETKTELRQIFKKNKPWHSVPFDTQTDFDNIRKALKILVEHSKRFVPIWHTKS